MRQRLQIAKNMVTRPRLIFMDEPTVGLDPQARLALWEILRELHLEIGRFYAQAELGDALIGLRNGIQAALVVLLAAIEARTSAGAHYRID